MIKFKLVDNRTRVAKKIKEYQDRLEELPKEFFRLTVDSLLDESPVDTGTYVDAHNIGVRVGKTSSHHRPKGQSKEFYIEKARERLYGQIQALDLDLKENFISNNSGHAVLVEYEGWKTKPEYAPYTKTRAKAPELLDRAKAKLGL